MRISDWSSDVCSSDLGTAGGCDLGRQPALGPALSQRGDAVASRRRGRSEEGTCQIRAYGRRQPSARARHIALRHARSEPFRATPRSEEHTSELQSLMRISYAVFCLKKKKKKLK